MLRFFNLHYSGCAKRQPQSPSHFHGGGLGCFGFGVVCILAMHVLDSVTLYIDQKILNETLNAIRQPQSPSHFEIRVHGLARFI